MKTTFLLKKTIILILSSLLFAACEKDEEMITYDYSVLGLESIEINGKNFDFDPHMEYEIKSFAPRLNDPFELYKKENLNKIDPNEPIQYIKHNWNGNCQLYYFCFTEGDLKQQPTIKIACTYDDTEIKIDTEKKDDYYEVQIIAKRKNYNEIIEYNLIFKDLDEFREDIESYHEENIYYDFSVLGLESIEINEKIFALDPNRNYEIVQPYNNSVYNKAFLQSQKNNKETFKFSYYYFTDGVINQEPTVKINSAYADTEITIDKEKTKKGYEYKISTSRKNYKEKIEYTLAFISLN